MNSMGMRAHPNLLAYIRRKRSCDRYSYIRHELKLKGGNRDTVTLCQCVNMSTCQRETVKTIYSNHNNYNTHNNHNNVRGKHGRPIDQSTNRRTDEPTYRPSDHPTNTKHFVTNQTSSLPTKQSSPAKQSIDR